MIGIPDDPTDVDICRILLFMELVLLPESLVMVLKWVDQVELRDLWVRDLLHRDWITGGLWASPIDRRQKED
jgi:hypothetical protein